MSYSGWGLGVSSQSPLPPFTIETLLSKVGTIFNRLGMGTKYCKGCDRDLPLSAFHNDKKMKDGLAFYCRECSSEYGKKYRDTPQGIYSNLKGRINFSAKHSNKSTWGYSRGRTELGFSRDEFIEWYDKQEKKCIYCDLSEEDLRFQNDKFNKGTIHLTIDCKDNDSGYVLDNIGLACLRCNSIKGYTFSFDEMREIAQKYIKPKRRKLTRNDRKQ